METKMYVGNLSFSTTEDELRDLFSQAGKVKSVTIIKDRASGRSKGFAFVEMTTQAEMEKAISELNGSLLDNRTLKIDMARPREERGPGGYDSRKGYSSRGSQGSKDNRNRNW